MAQETVFTKIHPTNCWIYSWAWLSIYNIPECFNCPSLKYSEDNHSVLKGVSWYQQRHSEYHPSLTPPDYAVIRQSSDTQRVCIFSQPKGLCHFQTVSLFPQKWSVACSFQMHTCLLDPLRAANGNRARAVGPVVWVAGQGFSHLCAFGERHSLPPPPAHRMFQSPWTGGQREAFCVSGQTRSAKHTRPFVKPLLIPANGLQGSEGSAHHA
jgi:hypothetical protein